MRGHVTTRGSFHKSGSFHHVGSFHHSWVIPTLRIIWNNIRIKGGKNEFPAHECSGFFCLLVELNTFLFQSNDHLGVEPIMRLSIKLCSNAANLTFRCHQNNIVNNVVLRQGRNQGEGLVYANIYIWELFHQALVHRPNCQACSGPSCQAYIAVRPLATGIVCIFCWSYLTYCL